MKTTFLHRIRKELCVLIALALLLPLLPKAVAAAAVANIDGKEFKKVSDAWDYAMSHNASVIEMLTDWNLTCRLCVNSGITVSIHMHGHMINRGKVDRNNPTKAYDTLGNGGVFILKDDSKLTIFGRDTDEPLLTYRGTLISSKHIWVYDGYGDTELEGGLITGGATDSDAGGAFTVEESARLELRDVTVAGNIADRYAVIANGRGGAILVEDDKSTVIMNGCTVAYNYAEWEGGAICVDDAENVRLSLRNSSIHDNWCDKSGGAICVPMGGDNATIDLKGTAVFCNHASVGAGLYLMEEGISVQYGTIRDNTATLSAGGIFIGDNGCTLQDVTVVNNTAKEYGGVLVAQSLTGTGTNVLDLTGKITIKGNTTSAKVASNLHLLGEESLLTNRAMLRGTPSDLSEIHISTDADGAITVQSAKYNDSIYVADDTSRVVYWNQKTGDTYFRYLMIGKEGASQPTQPTSPQKVLDPADISPKMGGMTLVTEYTYNECAVYRGFGGTDSTDLVGAYYYSDGYFLDDPYEYNEHLATLSMRLAMAAMNSSVWKDSTKKSRGYTLQPNHIKQMLSDIGIAEEDIYLSDTYLTKPDTDTIGYALGVKKLTDKNGADTGRVLIPIAVRGAGYEAEWASNVTLGKGDVTPEHQGFREAADQVLAGVEAFIDAHGLREKADNGQISFWIVGFSRAGATANLVSKSLVDSYLEDGNSIYGYDFEAPQGGSQLALQRKVEDYDCIHNILLAADVVPHVAMISMNFQRYGVDHYLPGTDAGTPSQYFRRYSGALDGNTPVPTDYEGDDTIPFRKDNDYYDTGEEEYEAQKEIMLKQLASSDHSVVFDDYFHLATISLLNTVTSQSDKIEEFGSDSVTAADWLPDFVYYLNQWLTGTSSARTLYADTYQYQAILRALMEAANTGTLNIDNALDRLLNVGLIMKIVAIVEVPEELMSIEIKKSAITTLLEEAKVIGQDSIPLTKDQVFPAIGMLLKILTGDLTDVSDYRLGTSVDYGDEDECLVMLATLVYNMDTIKLNHNHQVVYAWLRSYDDYYLRNENGTSDYWYTVSAAAADQVDTPYLTFTLNGTQQCTLQANEKFVLENGSVICDIKLHMSDRNAGGQVFYTIGDNTFIPDTYYDSLRPLDSEVDEALNANDTIVITAETVWYTTPSSYAAFTITRDETQHSVYVDGQLYGTYAAGEEVTVQAPDKDCYEFDYWYYSETNAADESAENDEMPVMALAAPVTAADEPVVTDPVISFSMPLADVYLDTNYKQKQVAAPLSTLPELADGQPYTNDREITLYTESGSEEEGFHIEFIVEMEDDSGMTGGQYSTDGPIHIFSLLGSGIDNYYPTRWTIKAKATCDGWLDSEVSVFHYTVDYSAQEFVVDVVNGAVSGGTRDGQNDALFHPGDVVTVRASDTKSGTFLRWTTEQEDIFTVQDPEEQVISFRMPFDDVTLTAEFEGGETPQTGDDAPLALWCVLSGLCILACGMLIRRRKRVSR